MTYHGAGTAYATTPHRRDAWCVKRENVMRDASKFFLLKEPPSADLLWFFTHRDMAPYLSKYKRFYIHNFWYSVPNVSNSDMCLYIFHQWSVILVLSALKHNNVTDRKNSTNKKRRLYVMGTNGTARGRPWITYKFLGGYPRESIKWRHARLAWCVLTALRAVNTRAQNKYASRITHHAISHTFSLRIKIRINSIILIHTVITVVYQEPPPFSLVKF